MECGRVTFNLFTLKSLSAQIGCVRFYLLVLLYLCVQRGLSNIVGVCGGAYSSDDDTSGLTMASAKAAVNLKKFPKPMRNFLAPEPERYPKTPPGVRPDQLRFKLKILQSDGLRTVLESSKKIKNQFEHAMNRTVTFFEALLGVPQHKVNDSFTLTEFVETDVTWSPNQTVVVNDEYDFYLIVHAGDASSHCTQGPKEDHANTLAFAKICTRKNEPIMCNVSNRYLVGSIYICMKALTGEAMHDLEVENILKHEIIHTLGMNGYALHYSHVYHTATLSWKSIHSTSNKQVMYVVLPEVVEAVKKHFNCSSLIGAQRENNGPNNSHWEYRLFGPELMTPTISRRAYLSNITLAFLKGIYSRISSTGLPFHWYPWVNMTMAEDLWYGKNTGCLFTNGSCKPWIDAEPVEDRPKTPSFPFCSKGNIEAYLRYKYKSYRTVELATCNPDKTSALTCELPEPMHDYQKPDTFYYSGKGRINKMRGKSEYADYCPVYADSTMGHTGKDSNCLNKDSLPKGINNTAGELFGPVNHKCFQQTIPFILINCNETTWKRLIAGHLYNQGGYSGAGCYKYKCAHGRLMVQAAYFEQDYYGYKVCWSKGTPITIRRMIDDKTYVQGQLVCPSCSEICGDSCEPEVYDLLPRDQLEPPCTSQCSTMQSLSPILLFMYMLTQYGVSFM